VAAWVSAASEALLAAALIAALASYAMAARKKNRWWLAVSLACYAAALLMKETAMVFPAIVFLFAWLGFDEEEKAGRVWRAFLETLPFIALDLVYVAVRGAVLNKVVTASAPLGFETIVFSLPRVLLSYGRLLVWPVKLSPFYPNPLVEDPGWLNFVVPAVVVVAAVCILLLITIRAWKATIGVESARAEGRLTILACAWTVIFLLPALYLPALEKEAFIQDRYLYVPSVGISILLALGLCRMGRNGRKIAGVPWVQALIALVVAGAMAVGTYAQSGIWANNVALFTRGTERAPQNQVAQHDLAAAFVDSKRYGEGIEILQRLLAQNPDDFVDNTNIGHAYMEQGDLAHAEAYMAKACRLHPDANRLYILAEVQYNLGHVDAAGQSVAEAISMDQNAPGYHYLLALTLERQNKLNAALEALQQEVAISPRDARSQRELSQLSAFLSKNGRR
jgi:tetratricopeptide (TPR) repeat protein